MASGSREIDWEHANHSVEQALEHPLNERAISCLQALVSESFDIGRNSTIDAVKGIIDDVYDDLVPKADLLAALERFRPE